MTLQILQPRLNLSADSWLLNRQITKSLNHQFPSLPTPANSILRVFDDNPRSGQFSAQSV
jgi:hypothetical protein